MPFYPSLYPPLPPGLIDTPFLFLPHTALCYIYPYFLTRSSLRPFIIPTIRPFVPPPLHIFDLMHIFTSPFPINYVPLNYVLPLLIPRLVVSAVSLTLLSIYFLSFIPSLTKTLFTLFSLNRPFLSNFLLSTLVFLYLQHVASSISFLLLFLHFISNLLFLP